MVGYDSETMSRDDSTKLPTPFGRYELLEVIGEGDLGRVFTARARNSQGFDKKLVIKRIRLEFLEDEAFRRAFLAEAKVALSLSHTNIVQVVELGEFENIPFIVMEHVGGMNLAQCNRVMNELGKQWDPLLAAFVVAEVAMGLDHAHRRRDLEGRPLGIVHQDVSPTNVLLSFEGAVKLTDFGMARVFGSERLERADHPRYLAPEQIRGEPVDPRADVYGCGLLLYEMLAGRPPLHDVSADTATERLGLGTVPVLGEGTRGSIEPHLVEVLSRSTAPWPDERYGDAAELYEALMSTVFGSGRQVGRRELVAHMEVLREAFEPTTLTPAEDVERAIGSWRSANSGGAIDPTSQIDLAYESMVDGLSLPSTLVEPEPINAPPTADQRNAPPMRGREVERQQLGDAVTAAARNKTSIVEIVGDEGVGKTRLVHEVVGKLRAREARLNYFATSCRDLHGGGRYTSARSMIRTILGLGAPTIGEDLDAATRRLREFGLSQYELEAVQDIIGVGPGSAPPGPGRARAAGRGLGQILRRLGDDTLTIVFWDDADLMDPDSARLLVRAKKHSQRASLLIIIARARGDTPWSGPLTDNVIELGQLEREPLVQLICDGLSARHVDKALAETVVNRAGGNARYASELTRLIGEMGRVSVEDGIAFLERDSGLHEMGLDQIIDARLDLRPDLERAVLEVAACIGAQFEVSLIVSTTGLEFEQISNVLEKLLLARFITRRGQESFAFVHQRLRARIIASLSSEDLQEIHGRIAEAMAATDFAHDASWRLRCADHLRKSGQRQRARDLLATSAAQLEVAGATDAAIDHFASALELTRGTEEEPVALALGLRTAGLALRCGRLREGIRAAQLSIELARRSRNKKDEIKALVVAGRLIGASGKIEDASNRFREALAVAQKLGDSTAHRMIRGAMGELLVQTGDYRRAQQHLEQALSDGGGPESARFMLLSAICRGRGGDRATAQDLLDRVYDALDESHCALQVEVMLASAAIDATAGLLEQSVEGLDNCREMARTHGLHHANALATHYLGCILLALGQPQRAFASLSYSYELSREYGFERLIRVNLVSMATLDVLHHHRLEPIERIKLALEEAREAGFLSDILQIRFYLGQAFLAVGQTRDARRQLDQARRAGRATGNLLFDADIELFLSRIATAR